MPTWAILVIGGVIPAICWGVTAIFQKQSAAAGAAPDAVYRAASASCSRLSGVVGTLLARDVTWPRAGVVNALLAGATFTVASLLLSYALWRYGAPISTHRADPLRQRARHRRHRRAVPRRRRHDEHPDARSRHAADRRRRDTGFQCVISLQSGSTHSNPPPFTGEGDHAKRGGGGNRCRRR